jgi:hypothetical protein
MLHYAVIALGHCMQVWSHQTVCEMLLKDSLLIPTVMKLDPKRSFGIVANAIYYITSSTVSVVKCDGC